MPGEAGRQLEARLKLPAPPAQTKVSEPENTSTVLVIRLDEVVPSVTDQLKVRVASAFALVGSVALEL